MVHRYAPFRRAASTLALLALAATLGAGPAAAQAYRTFLAGSNEVPPTETTARGIVTADRDGSTVSIGGYFEDLTSDIQAAHLHLGAPGQNGGVIFSLVVASSEENTAGIFDPADNSFTFNGEQLAALEAGNIYVNVHTSEYPNGEIRGNLSLLDGIVPISDARELGVGATVTVQGVVSRAKGQFAWFQDGTAGLAIRQVSGSAFYSAVENGDITSGTIIEVTGTISEFPSAPRGGVLQINQDDLASYSIVGAIDPPLPQTVSLDELITNGEAYESELVRVVGVSIAADPGVTFSAASSYDLSDREDVFSGGLRVGNAENTDVDGLEIPSEPVIVTGPLAQFTPSSNPDPLAGYQILPIEEVDVLPFLRASAQIIHNSPDPAAATVDIYVDIIGDTEGSMKFEDIAFRSATDFMPLPSDFDVRVSVAPGDSDGEGDALLQRTYRLADTSTVVLVATGVLDPSGFAANPDGADISFDVVAFDAKIEAEEVTQVDAAVFHGAPDVGPITVGMPGSGSLPPLVENLPFGEVSEYVAAEPQAIELFINSDELSGSAGLDLEPYAGLAVTVLASGFANPEANQNGESLALLLVSPLGETAVSPITLLASNEDDSPVLAFAVDGAYPNPAVQAARVRVALPAAAAVELTLYDVLGREVARTQTEAAAGRLALPVDAAQLAPGMYVYRVRAEEATGTVHAGTGRMTVVR